MAANDKPEEEVIIDVDDMEPIETQQSVKGSVKGSAQGSVKNSQLDLPNDKES